MLTVSERYGHYYRSAPPPAPASRYNEWLAEAERHLGVGRLLEVGAGGGAFVQAAIARGWSVDAVEVAPAGVERLTRLGARVFCGDLTGAGYEEGAFDLVVSTEVLEHLPQPAAHLVAIARVTRAGGRLLLTTPNFGGLSRRLLGLRWRVIDPEHLGYFTARTLGRATRRAGYSWISIRSRSLDISTWRSSVFPSGPARFNPEQSARLRDAIQSRGHLRAAKEGLNRVLGLMGLGDSLLMWARR